MTRLLTLASLFLLLFSCSPSAGDTPAELKIVGGTNVDTTDGLVGSVVAIGHDDNLVCTGIVLSRVSILTAAHCAPPKDYAKPVWVSPDLNAKTGRHFAAGEFTVHPGFSPTVKNSANDIAVLQLKEPLDAVKVIDLFDDQVPLKSYSTKVVLAGYGSTTSTVDDAGILRRTDSLFNSAQAQYNVFYVDSLADRNICWGDSGGPALVYDGDRPYVLGVSSFVIIIGETKCESGMSAFTDVRKFKDFIAPLVKS